MTREEKQKAIGALKMSVLLIAMTRKEFNNYIQTLNKIMDWLEQQPCDAISRECNNCAYYVNGANDEACDGCFADEYEHPNFKPKAQPCSDCISRQAVDELSKELVHTTRDKADFLCNFWEGLQKLPPVTPQPKMGYWIIKSETSAVCSRCHKNNLFYGDFCKWCGAKMVEPQESEE